MIDTKIASSVLQKQVWNLKACWNACGYPRQMLKVAINCKMYIASMPRGIKIQNWAKLIQVWFVTKAA